MKVPDILLSGNHEEINRGEEEKVLTEHWREEVTWFQMKTIKNHHKVRE